ncbi:MAG TPA: translation elongation factor 4, partial [Puia sp.]|nr:translation elongation factor 4 [Puia sp.]
EREKGITIKSHAIQINYHHNGEEYILNLIDTPGHVDFSYEVSRALAACEGALLLVDATQGIQAQTISNLYLAIENDLEIIPVVNKIDMDGAMIEEVKDQIIELIGCKPDDILLASARTGMGVEAILEAIVSRIPPPKGNPKAPLQALIFDSVFNSFRGIIVYYRIINGQIRKGDKVKFVSTGTEYEADEVGILKLNLEPREELATGNVGYIITGIKNAKEVKVGDTITLASNPNPEMIQGFEEVKPMVFAGIFPVNTDDFEELRDCMDKLQLNDASLTFELETSQALGFGFRCGFLGMLHMEIIQERLEREFNQTVITTVPNVSFIAYTNKGEKIVVNNPAEMPDPVRTEKIEEPFIKAQIITKPEYIGNIMTLCLGKRGILMNQSYLTTTRVELLFEMPLTEIVFDFYDKLKSQTRGYASFDYHPIGYRD